MGGWVHDGFGDETVDESVHGLVNNLGEEGVHLFVDKSGGGGEGNSCVNL